MNCTRSNIKTHVTDKEVNNGTDAARLADDNSLVHPNQARNLYNKQQINESSQRQSTNKNFYNEKRSQKSNLNSVNNLNNPVSNKITKQRMKPVCTHGKREGHAVQNCWALSKRKDQPRSGFVATAVIFREENIVNPNDHFVNEAKLKKKAKKQYSRGKSSTSVYRQELRASEQMVRYSTPHCDASRRINHVKSYDTVVREDSP
jgi:hypothetical protein